MAPIRLTSSNPSARPFVLITGVSTGIGHDACRYLIDRGFHVLGSVRKPADAERLQKEFTQHFTPLVFDVTDSAAIHRAVQDTSRIVGGRGLAGLVNNAGLSGAGPLQCVDMSAVRDMFEVNVFGLLAVTRAFLPLLGAHPDCTHGPGRIVNVSSISGGVAFPYVGVYAATKHAVEAMSDALRREVAQFGIRVIVIEPGAIKTPIWEKSQVTDGCYRDTPYAASMDIVSVALDEMGRTGKPVETVSRAICRALIAGKPKTRYPLVGLWYLRRFMSDRLLDRLLRKTMGLLQ